MSESSPRGAASADPSNDSSQAPVSNGDRLPPAPAATVSGGDRLPPAPAATVSGGDRQPPAPAAPVIDPEMPQPLSMGAVLRISAMRRLWLAQLISVFGDFLALYAVITVLTFRLHATATQVTGVQIAYLLPIAILGIFAGVFVDRWNVKPTLVASDAIRAVLVLALMVSTRMWHFYAVLAAISVVSSFFAPAQGIAIRSAVPMHGLRSANTLLQQVMFGMRILGPSAATTLVHLMGPTSCYLLDSLSFVASALLIASLTLARSAAGDPAAGTPAAVSPAASTPVSEASAVRRIWTDMRQGFNFIVHHAALFFVILSMAAGMFILGCFGPLIAIYVRDNLHALSGVFGLANTLIGVGMLVGTNLLAMAAKRMKDATLVYLGLGGIIVGLMCLAGLLQVWSTYIGTFVIGLAVAGIIIPAQTLFQRETPPALMGRVGSTMMSMIFTAQICGLALSGILAAVMGVRRVFAVCAVAMALFIVAGRLWFQPKEQTASVPPPGGRPA